MVYEVSFSNDKHAYEEILYFKVDGCQVARFLNLTHIYLVGMGFERIEVQTSQRHIKRLDHLFIYY